MSDEFVNAAIIAALITTVMLYAAVLYVRSTRGRVPRLLRAGGVIVGWGGLAAAATFRAYALSLCKPWANVPLDRTCVADVALVAQLGAVAAVAAFIALHFMSRPAPSPLELTLMEDDDA
ncbi:MAG TPA: hypothetical protein VMR74_12670 [Gammaproteobacteria bacterium]|nr:hypothetical protein [Gammaproteobacteria bacterium]